MASESSITQMLADEIDQYQKDQHQKDYHNICPGRNMAEGWGLDEMPTPLEDRSVLKSAPTEDVTQVGTSTSWTQYLQSDFTLFSSAEAGPNHYQHHHNFIGAQFPTNLKRNNGNASLSSPTSAATNSPSSQEPDSDDSATEMVSPHSLYYRRAQTPGTGVGGYKPLGILPPDEQRGMHCTSADSPCLSLEVDNDLSSGAVSDYSEGRDNALTTLRESLSNTMLSRKYMVLRRRNRSHGAVEEWYFCGLGVQELQHLLDERGLGGTLVSCTGSNTPNDARKVYGGRVTKSSSKQAANQSSSSRRAGKQKASCSRSIKVMAETDADSDDEETLKFACPFPKHNAVRYEHVRGPCISWPGFEGFKRVSEHVRRYHSIREKCPFCSSKWSTAATAPTYDIAFQEHEANCSHLATRRLEQLPEPMTPEQEENCNKQYRGVEGPRAWTELYQDLFPGDYPIPSPYYDYLTMTHRLMPRVIGNNSSTDQEHTAWDVLQTNVHNAIGDGIIDDVSTAMPDLDTNSQTQPMDQTSTALSFLEDQWTRLYNLDSIDGRSFHDIARGQSLVGQRLSLQTADSGYSSGLYANSETGRDTLLSFPCSEQHSEGSPNDGHQDFRPSGDAGIQSSADFADPYDHLLQLDSDASFQKFFEAMTEQGFW